MDKEIREFTQEIGATKPQPNEKGYELFKSVFRRSNYFRHQKGFMIIKISRIENPFWGVGKKYIDFLNETDVNYFLVLLESNKSGYVFTKREINRMIKRKKWKVAKDDNYKIISPPMRNSFRNVTQFQQKIGIKKV
jgi:hypothetical protein